MTGRLDDIQKNSEVTESSPRDWALRGEMRENYIGRREDVFVVSIYLLTRGQNIDIQLLYRR